MMQGSGCNPLAGFIILVPLFLLFSLATGSPAVTIEAEVVTIGTAEEMTEAGREGLQVGDVIELEITEDQLNSLEGDSSKVVCLTWDDMAIATEPTDELASCNEPIELVLVSSP